MLSKHGGQFDRDRDGRTSVNTICFPRDPSAFGWGGERKTTPENGKLYSCGETHTPRAQSAPRKYQHIPSKVMAKPLSPLPAGELARTITGVFVCSSTQCKNKCVVGLSIPACIRTFILFTYICKGHTHTHTHTNLRCNVHVLHIQI